MSKEYESEAMLEEKLIKHLELLGYTRINLKNIDDVTDVTKFTTLKYEELQNVVMTFTITDKYSLHNFTNKFIKENSNRSENNNGK